MRTTRSEDILIFPAINPQITKISSVRKALDEFFDYSQSEDPTNRFNIILFEEAGPVYYEDFLFDKEPILQALSDFKNNLVSANITGGIMVAITFIIDVFKRVNGKTFRLIVLTDPTTPSLRNQEAVQPLIDQVIEFPFFLDFVVIGKGDPRKELELMKFAKRNRGEVYFAQSNKELNRILLNLAEKKELDLPESGEQYRISEENEPFFEHLADDLWVVDEEERKGKRCLICGQSFGELIQCPKCESIVHGECLAHWAKTSNIGIPHVFRCMNCFNLLRLPKDYVLNVQMNNLQPQINFTPKNQYEELQQNQSDGTPQLTKTKDPMGGNTNLDWDYINNSDDGWDNSDFSFKDDSELLVQFCPECGALNFPETTHCSKCGHLLK